MSTKNEWNVVPNALSAFTPQGNFAYRLQQELRRAFYAGARYAAANPAVMEQKRAAVSFAELQELPNFIGDEFTAWVHKASEFYDQTFGLDTGTLATYFPGRP